MASIEKLPVFADARLSDEVFEHLQDYGKLLKLSTENLVYSAISGHPDIFMCKLSHAWILAPNIPLYVRQFMEESQLTYVLGKQVVGDIYPSSAIYNVSSNEKYAVAAFKRTEEKLREEIEREGLEKIEVRQAYARCNLLLLKNSCFLCSDRGIEKALLKKGLKGVYVNPSSIILPEMPNGFIGGCCGIKEDTLFFTGSLSCLDKDDEKKVRDLADFSEYHCIELSRGPLLDGGALLFA